MRRIILLTLLSVSVLLITPLAEAASTNILYLNSTRGSGTGTLGSFRSAISDALDGYQGGTVFDVDYVQTHVAGDLETKLGANPVGHYDQIWFDTTILNTALLNSADFAALNTWAANDQPEFILDSTFFFRNKTTSTISTTGANVTINEALALRDAGGGIFIGTDHDQFTATANQILNNFGFDTLFTGVFFPQSNGQFVGNLMTSPEPLGTDFFSGHVAGLSTSTVPLGNQVLNANGGNRTIDMQQAMYSIINGVQIPHVSASFDPGQGGGPVINPPPPIPEPGTAVLAIVGLAGLVVIRRRRR